MTRFLITNEITTNALPVMKRVEADGLIEAIYDVLSYINGKPSIRSSHHIHVMLHQ